jgi:hypothetical protein
MKITIKIPGLLPPPAQGDWKQEFSMTPRQFMVKNVLLLSSYRFHYYFTIVNYIFNKIRCTIHDQIQCSLNVPAYFARVISYLCKMFMKLPPVACNINVYDRRFYDRKLCSSLECKL